MRTIGDIKTSIMKMIINQRKKKTLMIINTLKQIRIIKLKAPKK